MLICMGFLYFKLVPKISFLKLKKKTDIVINSNVSEEKLV